MKDISTAASRHARNNLVYPKKRPSPHGVAKSKAHKSPLLPANGVARPSPRPSKAALLQQQQRQKAAQALAARQSSVYLEDEYRDEIRLYMHDMEVIVPFIFIHPVIMLIS